MSVDALVEVDIQRIREDIQRGIRECTERGLTQSVKWLAELNFSLRHFKIETDDTSTSFREEEKEGEERYLMAKSFFDCQEYDRAAYFLENCVSPKCNFLKMYSKYLSSEKKRLDNMQDSTDYASETCKSKVLRELLCKLQSKKESLDGYSLYLYGLILKKLDLRQQAVEALEEAVQAVPWFWGAWRELATLVSDREMLGSLRLPSSWITYFFLGQAYTELKLSEQALDVYNILKSLGFEKSTYLTAQVAIAHHDRRDVDSALELFKEVYHEDPYRLDDWDVYSHLLYVMEKKTELASLAHQAVEIDKYRVQTCCVIGNYYSLRSEHHKAVVYFQRALVLNPQYLVAWILMGHEFIELQNSNAAIQCYRQAIEVNRNDYRAWNGLGQAYEIIGLHGYCVYYYAKAAQLRPSDSRMLVSLGEAFEKMEKIPNALKCYYRAHSAGDIEGMALFRLGKLYEKLVMNNSAAAAYAAACADGAPESRELPTALRYLAHYHLKRDDVDHAAYYAYKCLQHEETKEEGKALLKAVAEKRATSCAAPVSKPPPNIDVTPTPDCRHTPLGERQAFTQNYSTPSVLQPSPVNSKDSSRYKI